MPSATPTHSYVRTAPVMGTVVSFDIRDAVDAHAAVADAIALLHQVDERFSTYRPTSVVCQIDRGELPVAQAPADVQWVLRRCEELSRESAGYFDARARGVLDPSALVKGWAIQRAAGVLEHAGLKDFCITGGGDIVCRGGALPLDRWRIGIQHPLDPSAIAAVATGSGFAVATSGTYERGQHIRDPHSGVAPRGLLSVTVTGPDLATADAYSTAAFAMGTYAPSWTSNLPLRGYEAMSVLTDGTVQSTPDFPYAEATA